MKNPYVLMVDYDKDDQYITLEYFNDAAIPVRILEGSDELFHELSRCTELHIALPALILINFYIGPIGTRDTLLKLKQHPLYNHIPVVILSESADKSQIKEAYSWGASSFIRKPALVKETNQKIENFLAYWFNTVELV